jgi:predicted lipoprotein with Yx(FWY)xxD motif
VPAGTVVSSWSSSSLGEIISDSAGRTLYIYTPDEGQSSPQCTSTGGCASTWPPLDAHGTLHAQGHAQQSLLGTEDGQVTYNGHPLYFYAGDSAPHETNGQGVGGIWYVINTNGSVHL